MSQYLGLLLTQVAVAGSGGLGVFAACSMLLRIRARDMRHLGSAATEMPLLVALRPALERLAFVASLLPQQGHKEWARRTLKRANLHRQWSPELIETMKLGCSLCVFAVFLLLFQLWFEEMPWMLLLIMSFVSYFVPDMAIYSRAGERQEGMRRNLPFVIDLIAVSAEAGLAFQQAIRNVVNNSKGEGAAKESELIAEFEQLLASLQMGRTLGDALNETADRVGIDEFKTFVNSILQAEKLGTPMSETLKRQSAELRQKLASRMEAKANQAPVKILFPLMIFIFPVTGWVIIGPVLIRVFTQGF